MTRKWVAAGLWLAGAALFVWILSAQDWSELVPPLSGVGWGIFAIVAAHFVPMLADTRAWSCLLSGTDNRPRFSRLIRMRWLGESVNTLLPAAQVGGDLLRARLLQVGGVPGAVSVATVLVNLTLTVITLLAFILFGIGAASAAGTMSPLLPSVAGGVLVGLLAVGGFVVVQRAGIIGYALARVGQLLGGAELIRLGSSSKSLNDAIAELYERHVVLWRSAVWSFCAWINGAFEVWLVLYFIGVDSFVYTSSVATLGLRASGSADEETPIDESHIIGPYKRTKLLAERAVRRTADELELPIVIVNPSTPFGPGDIKPTPTGRIVLDALAGRMPAFVDTGLNVGHVDDIAQGHVLAMHCGRVGERYVLGGENLTLQSILKHVADAAGRRPPSVRIPHAVAVAAAVAAETWSRVSGNEPRVTRDGVRMARRKMYFTSRKAREELGYAPRPAKVAIEDAVRWFAAERNVGRLN